LKNTLIATLLTCSFSAWSADSAPTQPASKSVAEILLPARNAVKAENYEKAIELDPEDAVSYNNLGLVEEKMGRKEKAQQHFSRADSLSGYPPKK